MNDEQKTTLNWRQLFPMRGFAHSMALRRCNAGRFFMQPYRQNNPITAERYQSLREYPKRYVAIDDSAIKIWFFASNVMWQFCGIMPKAMLPPRNAQELFESCVSLTGSLEHDWILLRPDEREVHRMIGAGVCFPSNWDIHEKMGKPVEEIHAIVPGLNASLGAKISKFLSNLTPFKAWQRENWGLSADAELNHHPSRKLKRLDNCATLSTTWLRLERQFFCKMHWSKYDCPPFILFAIRVYNFLLDELIQEPGSAARIAHSLETMPDDVAAYKGIAPARAGLIAQLKAVTL